MNHEVVLEFFHSSHQAIEAIVKIGLTAQPLTISKEELVKSVKNQLTEVKPINISNFIEMKNFTINKQLGTTDVGFTKSVQLNDSTLFSQLLTLKFTLENSDTYGQHYWLSQVEHYFNIISSNLENEEYLNNFNKVNFNAKKMIFHLCTEPSSLMSN